MALGSALIRGKPALRYNVGVAAWRRPWGRNETRGPTLKPTEDEFITGMSYEESLEDYPAVEHGRDHLFAQQ